MILTRRWALLAAIGSVTLLGATGCSASEAASPAATEASTPSGAITVYNAQHEELTQAWADEFTAETGVTVTLRNGSDSEL
ncbi:MAG TPA: iron ABC transporter substrate-binding protein, partial [Cryobacterium sp.]|nr:iron ABC transporter substrate-binding protein [Cryobacterium sp.]